uniref:Uncharacterized protein n=1 Tax=Anguilla anguilla TaxID=7936 RepID=A0A0E9XCC3_ANGAN
MKNRLFEKAEVRRMEILIRLRLIHSSFTTVVFSIVSVMK